MNILYVMIPVSLLLGAGFLTAFIWSINDGQIDDTQTPAHRIFNDENGDVNEPANQKL